MTLSLSGSTFGYLYHASIEDALRALAGHGFTGFELTPTPPHPHPPAYGTYERRQLCRHIQRLGMHCVSVNPSYADLNLISTNPEVRDLTARQLRDNLRLAHDLEAHSVVVICGRRHGLTPAPDEDAAAVLYDQLDVLLRDADVLGVTVALENSPYGFMTTAADLVSVVEAVDHPRLGITYDSANALMSEDPAAGLHRVGGHLTLAHISDSWRDRWAHTHIGAGDVDFGAFAAALDEMGFAGDTVYELVDGEHPDPGLPGDLAQLHHWGWAV